MKQKIQPKEKGCFFTMNGYKDIDYKDANLLRRFTSSYGKILPKRKTHVNSKYQRKLHTAIKRARFMAMLPYVKK